MNLTAEDWSGDFGDAYLERNLDVAGRGAFWNGLVAEYGINSVLEVGCSTGANLASLEVPCAGVDVNQTALDLVPEGIQTYNAPATDLPFPTNMFDLVLTFGVLIHIPPDELDTAMREIVRCSEHFVFCGEYLGAVEGTNLYETVPYRDAGVLWKRDYGKLYQDIGLELVDRGFLEGEPWDRNRVDWWLLHH